MESVVIHGKKEKPEDHFVAFITDDPGPVSPIVAPGEPQGAKGEHVPGPAEGHLQKQDTPRKPS
jgi:hypothetical protein